jgi:hypothetical protein
MRATKFNSDKGIAIKYSIHTLKNKLQLNFEDRS